jgi:hypothetical protein
MNKKCMLLHKNPYAPHQCVNNGRSDLLQCSKRHYALISNGCSQTPTPLQVAGTAKLERQTRKDKCISCLVVMGDVFQYPVMSRTTAEPLCPAEAASAGPPVRQPTSSQAAPCRWSVGQNDMSRVNAGARSGASPRPSGARERHVKICTMRQCLWAGHERPTREGPWALSACRWSNGQSGRR